MMQSHSVSKNSGDTQRSKPPPDVGGSFRAANDFRVTGSATHEWCEDCPRALSTAIRDLRQLHFTASIVSVRQIPRREPHFGSTTCVFRIYERLCRRRTMTSSSRRNLHTMLHACLVSPTAARQHAHSLWSHSR
jgi:hypothetical protein